MNGSPQTQSLSPVDFPEDERRVAPTYSTASIDVMSGSEELRVGIDVSRLNATEPLRQEPGRTIRLGPKMAVEYRPATQEPLQTSPTLFHQAQELARLRGVVLGRGSDGTTVTVQFPEPDLTVEFPVELFDAGLAKYGQVVDYVVKLRPNGFRFQCFESRSADDNPVLPELESLLSRIDD